MFAATAGMALRLPKVAVAPDAASPMEKAELRSPGVLLAAGAMGLIRGIVGFLTLYYAFHFREEEQLAAFGFIAAVSLLGTLVGSLVAPRLRAVWPEERMLITVLVLTFGIGLLSFVFGGPAGAAVLGGAVGIAVDRRQAGLRLDRPARRPRRQPGPARSPASRPASS